MGTNLGQLILTNSWAHKAGTNLPGSMAKLLYYDVFSSVDYHLLKLIISLYQALIRAGNFISFKWLANGLETVWSWMLKNSQNENNPRNQSKSSNSWQHWMTSRDVMIPVEFTLQKHMSPFTLEKITTFDRPCRWGTSLAKCHINFSTSSNQLPSDTWHLHSIHTVRSTTPVINMENLNIPLVLC